MLSPTALETRNADITRFTTELAGHHHPNFQSATAVPDGTHWNFTPFTGTEHMPQISDKTWEAWRNSEISAEALEFLKEQYVNAVVHWKQAHYTRRTEAAVATAETAWTILTDTRTALDATFEALTSTEDNHWRAAVSRLLTAQENALTAATAWDTAFGTIAGLMADTPHLGWTSEEFQRLGVRPEWGIEADPDYYRLKRTDRPAHVETTTVIERQHAHIRAIADLIGDRTPTT